MKSSVDPVVANLYKVILDAVKPETKGAPVGLHQFVDAFAATLMTLTVATIHENIKAGHLPPSLAEEMIDITIMAMATRMEASKGPMLAALTVVAADPYAFMAPPSTDLPS